VSRCSPSLGDAGRLYSYTDGRDVSWQADENGILRTVRKPSR
jgi:hypothetical protein